MQVLDISNIAKIFSYHIYNSIQDSTLDIKKYDRWFVIGWRSGNSEINELGLNFLEAYFKDKGCSNVEVKNLSIGLYKIDYTNALDIKDSFTFKTGSTTPSYLCCNFYFEEPKDCLCFIPYQWTNELIASGMIIKNGEFDWSMDNTDAITLYKKLIELS